MSDNKELFIQTYHKNIHRPGAEQPARVDGKHRLFHRPGLHALPRGLRGRPARPLAQRVQRADRQALRPRETDDLESFTIVSLLHDLCKAGFYKTELRNRKNDRGEWEKVPVYAIDDQFPYGHGEKSVYLIERFMRLKTEEAMAVRWHMGGFDDAVRGGSFALAHAFEKYPLAVKLHLSDLEATYLHENRDEPVSK